MTNINTSEIKTIHEVKEVDIKKEQNNITDIANQSKRVINVPVDFNNIVPVEERAVELESVEYSGAKEAGYFTPAYGMAQIVNRCDGRIYAGIWGEANGKKMIRFCIKDKLDNYSTIITMRQSEFIIAMGCNFTINKDMDKTFKKIVDNFITNFTLDYLDRIPVSLQAKPELILNAIALNIDSLPCHEYNNGMSNAEAIYSEIMKYLNKHYNNPIDIGMYSHKAYYSLSICQIDQIANHLEMSSKELLKTLKNNHLLYTTPSSVGYQTKVKTGTTNGYNYCIKKLEILDTKNNHSNN